MKKQCKENLSFFQVDCLQQLCILGAREDPINEQYVTQYSPRHSNQWWRLVTSMYLHRGILDWIVFTSLQMFRAEKRSAQASAHLLSQAQGGLFCVLTVFVCCWSSE